jgi:hypothetical protein
MNDELEITRVETVVAYLRYFPKTFPKELKTTTIKTY